MSDLEKWVDEMIAAMYLLRSLPDDIDQPPATHPPLPPRATQHQRQLVGLITNV